MSSPKPTGYNILNIKGKYHIQSGGVAVLKEPYGSFAEALQKVRSLVDVKGCIIVTNPIIIHECSYYTLKGDDQ